jgi:hypothetical protein
VSWREVEAYSCRTSPGVFSNGSHGMLRSPFGSSDSKGMQMTTPPATAVGTKVLFENERVRVWDLALAPGESLAKHIHRTDYFFIVESGGLIRFADPDNPADYHDVQFEDDQVTFIDVPEGKVDNRLTNIGEKRHRNYVIELKRSPSA